MATHKHVMIVHPKFGEVLIDATSVGGGGTVKRQSIKPFIGMEVEFITYNGTEGYNFTIV